MLGDDESVLEAVFACYFHRRLRELAPSYACTVFPLRWLTALGCFCLAFILLFPANWVFFLAYALVQDAFTFWNCCIHIPCMTSSYIRVLYIGLKQFEHLLLLNIVKICLIVSDWIWHRQVLVLYHVVINDDCVFAIIRALVMHWIVIYNRNLNSRLLFLINCTYSERSLFVKLLATWPRLRTFAISTLFVLLYL